MAQGGGPVEGPELKMKSGFSARRFFYGFRYRIGEYLLRGFVRLFPWVPPRLMLSLTALASRLTFVLLWKYRRRMEENMASVMAGELRTRQEIRRLARAAWDNLVRGIYEAIAAIHSTREGIRSSVGMEGEEILREALKKGKGVIALSAHLSNFILTGVRLAAAGYPFSALVKQPREEGFAKLMDHYRAAVGGKTISARPRREAARQILKALRKNEIVLMIADEFKSGEVEVEFLGRMVPAPRGPATLAMRSGAAVVPLFVARDGLGRLTLHIWPEIDLIRTGKLQEDVASNVALFTRQLEAMVRRHPDQWNWLGFHRNGRTSRAQMALSPETYSSQEEAATTRENTFGGNLS